MKELTGEEKQMILESLKYTKIKFESYQDYPSQEFKKKRIEEVDSLIQKLKEVFKNG